MIPRPFAQEGRGMNNILLITLSISSSGPHASSIPNHSLKYQGDESRQEKKETEFHVSQSQQVTESWHIATSSRTHESTWIFITRNDAYRWAKVFNVASLSRDYRKGACLYTWSQWNVYSKRIYPDTLHIDWKSETAISYNWTAISYNCMYLKSPKDSKRFLSSLTRDILIAFRMTAKQFSFTKKSQIGVL